jgi:hypothetical protein
MKSPLTETDHWLIDTLHRTADLFFPVDEFMIHQNSWLLQVDSRFWHPSHEFLGKGHHPCVRNFAKSLFAKFCYHNSTTSYLLHKLAFE